MKILIFYQQAGSTATYHKGFYDWYDFADWLKQKTRTCPVTIKSWVYLMDEDEETEAVILEQPMPWEKNGDIGVDHIATYYLVHQDLPMPDVYWPPFSGAQLEQQP